MEYCRKTNRKCPGFLFAGLFAENTNNSYLQIKCKKCQVSFEGKLLKKSTKYHHIPAVGFQMKHEI